MRSSRLALAAVVVALVGSIAVADEGRADDVEGNTVIVEPEPAAQAATPDDDGFRPWGEIVVSYYQGNSWTTDSDLELKRPGGTDLTFDDIDWDDKSWDTPFYYGARATWWLWFAPDWGVSVDFTHAKAIVDEDDVTRIKGTDGGAPVDEMAPIDDYIDRFEMSHGLNFLTFNLMKRFFLTEQRGDSFLGRFQPYLGAGAGLVIPHVEATVDGDTTDEYQIAGTAVTALAGVNFDVWGPFSIFGEYKANWADADMDLDGGGSIETKTWTHQALVGVSIGF